MYPCCLANFVMTSTRWLPEHICFVVDFVAILVSEDCLFMTKQKSKEKLFERQTYAAVLGIGGVILP